MNLTKKVIALALVIATMICLSVPAIAADEETKKETMLPNGAKYALDQHEIDTATEAKGWAGEENSYTDDKGNNWKYLNGRNYIVSKDDSRYLYRVLEDGTIAICHDYNAEAFDGEAKIPSELDDKTVSKIDAYAFYNCANVTGIRIPDTVKEVGYMAFANCAKLERVVIGKGVEKFNAQALTAKQSSIYFAGTEEDADKIVVWDKASLNAKTSFNWENLAKSSTSEETTIMFEVDADKLEDTTTEYSLFIWFFKVHLKTIFDSYIALMQANFEGIKTFFSIIFPAKEA